MREPTMLELKVANAIAAALQLTSMELRKVANITTNLGVTPALALAMALSSDKSIAILDPEDDPVLDQ